MIRIQYFARYREHLGLQQETLAYVPGWQCIEDLRQHLLERGGRWSVLAEKSLLCARNEELCTLAEVLADGDDVAFFPPVTGG